MLGKLVGHGAAPYQNEAEGSNSYFIRIRAFETEAAARRAALAADESARPIDGRSTQQSDGRDSSGIHIAWGTGLKWAIRDSKSHVKVGDIVGVRRVGRQPLDGGKYQNLWEVEKVQFITQRHLNARKVVEDYRAARQSGIDDPAARALYMIQVHLEKLAAISFSNPDDRQKYIKRVTREIETMSDREAVIGRLARKVQAATNRDAEPVRKESAERGNSGPQREEMVRE
jgi:hypothetical protein